MGTGISVSYACEDKKDMKTIRASICSRVNLFNVATDLSPHHGNSSFKSVSDVCI